MVASKCFKSDLRQLVWGQENGDNERQLVVHIVRFSTINECASLK